MRYKPVYFISRRLVVQGGCPENVHQKRAEAGGLQTKEKQYVPDYLSIAGNELMAFEIGPGGTVIFEPSLKQRGMEVKNFHLQTKRKAGT